MTTAVQSPTCVTMIIGNTHSAKPNMPVLRARDTVQPFLIRCPVTQPPQILSTVMMT